MGDKHSPNIKLSEIDAKEWTTRLLLYVINEDGNGEITAGELAKLDYDGDGVPSVEDAKKLIHNQDAVDHILTEYCESRFLDGDLSKCGLYLRIKGKRGREQFFLADGKFEKAKKVISGYQLYKETFQEKLIHGAIGDNRMQWSHVMNKKSDDYRRVAFKKFDDLFKAMIQEYNNNKFVSQETKTGLLNIVLEYDSFMFKQIDSLIERLNSPLLNSSESKARDEYMLKLELPLRQLSNCYWRAGLDTELILVEAKGRGPIIKMIR